MKKNYFKFLAVNLVLLFPFMVTAQCNDDDPNNINSQQELDDYLAANPDCTELYELELSGNITDLSGLSNITVINYFYINDCPLLTDLTGLHNIDTIRGNLGFYGTMGLKNLCGLGRINYIGQDLRLEDCISIESLIGLNPDLVIADDIRVEGNIKLKSLDGLGSVNFVGSSLYIKDNPMLADCCGVQHLLNSGSPITWLTIENNATNCNSSQEILADSCSSEKLNCLSSSSEILATKNLEVNLFPNPAKDFIEVIGIPNVSIEQLIIYNSLGQAMLHILEPESRKISVAHLPQGVYFVLIEIEDNLDFGQSLCN